MSITTKETRFKVSLKGASHFVNAPTGLIAAQRLHAKLLKKQAAEVAAGYRYEIDEYLESFAVFKAAVTWAESTRW